MAYVVVHGADRVRDLSASASECLALVKTLQARAEAPIEITDDRGVPLRLRDLEALHKTEVEEGLPNRRVPAAEFDIDPDRLRPGRIIAPPKVPEQAGRK